MVQSAPKCLACATADSSIRCSKKPGYLSAPFNSVVRHILILSPKLWGFQNRLFYFSSFLASTPWQSYQGVQIPIQWSTNQTVCPSNNQNRGKQSASLVRLLRNKVKKLENADKISPSLWTNNKTRQDNAGFHCHYSINLWNISAASHVHFFTRLILWLSSSSPSKILQFNFTANCISTHAQTKISSTR